MAKTTGKTKKHKWTVMVYLAGDTADVLSAEMIFALKEMKEADPEGKIIGPAPEKPVAVVALFDPPVKDTKLEQYVINQSQSKCLKNDKVKDVKRKPLIKARLLDFVSECIKEHPADKYMLVLSGHGSGPAGNYLFPEQNPEKALSLDKLSELTKQIRDHLGRSLDVLALSCCLANMIEICHALGEYDSKTKAFQPYVNYLIGPEGFEPLTGWPFKEILGSLADKAARNAGIEPIAKDIVDQYNGYYEEYDRAGISTDLAAINLNYYGPLVGLVADLGKCLKRVIGSGAIQLAQLKTQAYLNFTYLDLWDFCNWLQEYDNRTGDLCMKIKNAIESAVGGRKGCAGPMFKGSNGLGIYLPWTEIARPYSKLQFAEDTGWHIFLKSYYESRFRDGMFNPNPPMTAGVMIQGEGKPLSSLVVLPR